jgi:hypothetical protein
MTTTSLVGCVSLFAALLLTSVAGQESAQRSARAYFGDLHLHTGFSFDVHSSTNITAGPDEAYRYARGEEVMMEGKKYRRAGAPLDFLAVTDHVEWMVEPGRWTAANAPAHLRAISESYRATLKDGGISAWIRLGWPTYPKQTTGPELRLWSKAAWAKQVEAADRNYRPGTFTTLFGYEWTSQTADDIERFVAVHRNVIAGRPLHEVFTSLDSDKPEDLWAFLARVNAEGGDGLSIANHPEAGKGNTFPLKNSSGQPLDARYAEFRNAIEPVVDIAPSFEAHPALSPGDPFTGFTSGAHSLPAALGPGYDWAGAYARTIISRGMMIAEGNGGYNPYRIGFIGTSDFHSARSDSAQDAHLRGYSGNLTGAWASKNTREQIVGAIRRRETFATSGPRISVRFFGGWAFNAALLRHSSWVDDAYRIGVPMGGELSCATAPAPSFIVWAQPDSEGSDLERLQVVKIWVENGKHAERVYDVASSSGHDSEPATRESSAREKGDRRLAAVWLDPDFDPRQYSAYYLRVLEVPSLDGAVVMKRGERREDAARVPFRERAWSSPIWYEPSSRNRAVRTCRIRSRRPASRRSRQEPVLRRRA